jgi:hypothetical protein
MSVETITQFNALDRCDRCGAQAYLEVEIRNGLPPLMFCGHHSNTLALSAFTVLRDERHLLRRTSYLEPAK